MATHSPQRLRAARKHAERLVAFMERDGKYNGVVRRAFVEGFTASIAECMAESGQSAARAMRWNDRLRKLDDDWRAAMRAGAGK